MKRHLVLASLVLGVASPFFSVFMISSIAASGNARSKLIYTTIVNAPIRSPLSAVAKFRVPANLSGAPSALGAPTAFTVTNSNDTGPGSLRDAITLANSNPGPDIINFGPGIGTINVGSTSGNMPLPDITEGVTIDSGAQRVELNGT